MDPTEGEFMDLQDPAQGLVYGKLPISCQKDVDIAVQAASKAFGIWSNTHPQERSDWLNKIADNLEDRKEQLAAAESRDNGKPITQARELDIPRAAANFRFSQELFCSRPHRRIIPATKLLITPIEFP